MKYKLTGYSSKFLGSEFYRIEACKDFSNVKKGDLGGYVESEKNLSQDGNAWVYDDAKVFSRARVFGNAEVSGDAWVSGNAWVSGEAKVSGDAEVSGDCWICDEAEVSGEARVYGDARIERKSDIFTISKIGSEDGILTAFRSKKGIEVTRGCFLGTLEEFEKAVERTHKGNKYGEEYQEIISSIKQKLGEGDA